MDRKNFIKQLILIPSAILALPGRLLAEEKDVAKVVEIKGEATIAGAAAKVGSKAKVGDKVTTGKGAMAILKFEDESVLQLRGSSTVTITFAEKKSILSIIAGAALGMFESGDREVRTTTTVAGVRGTAMYAMIESETSAYFCVCYGVVDFNAAADAAIKQTVESNGHRAIRVIMEDGKPTIVEAPGRLDHTDAELNHLTYLFNKAYSSWKGRKPSKDGDAPKFKYEP